MRAARQRMPCSYSKEHTLSTQTSESRIAFPSDWRHLAVQNSRSFRRHGPARSPSARTQSLKTEEVGTVIEVKDGVVQLQGLDNVGYGELIQFQTGVRAMVIDLTDEGVQAIVLGEYLDIKALDVARATGITLSIPVSNEILGRVVNPLGEPIDGGQKIGVDKLYPIEKKAPGVVSRQSVSVPLQTGIKAIDSLVPIGRGQRELIIGDRGGGKTTSANY